ncbi:MAG TPA: hypothetical protein VD865_08765 [Stenotrophomonas sp.]|nr:hypothetical protein [Stenotrophomonas sp.]
MREKFRPSNGTEGACFIEAFCCQCARSEHLQPDACADSPAGCLILDLTFLHDIEDAEYPDEWICDEAGPRCTAFVREGEAAPTPRCSRTPDMFAAFSQEGGNA